MSELQGLSRPAARRWFPGPSLVWRQLVNPTVQRRLRLAGWVALGLWSAFGIVDVIRFWRFSGGGADWANLVAATHGNPYDTLGFRWSPVAATLLGLIVPLGLPIWQVGHVVALSLLRPRWMALAVMAWWPFWHDVMNGNALTFVFVAAWLAISGSRPATLAFYAMAVLMPRPLMLPVTAWLLWHEPWSRRWFVGIAVAHAGLVLGSGLTADWVSRLLETAPGEVLHPWNWLPSRWIGLAWVPVGLIIAAWLTRRGRLGIASVMASPYVVPYYLLLVLLEAAPTTRAPVPVPRGE